MSSLEISIGQSHDAGSACGVGKVEVVDVPELALSVGLDVLEGSGSLELEEVVVN